MKTRVLLMAAIGIFLSAAQALAQEKTVSGRVTNEQGQPVPAVQVVVRGSNVGTTTNDAGRYTLRAAVGQVLQFRRIGTAPEERTVGESSVIDVVLRSVATSLDAVVVTALGQEVEQRAIGTAQQTVSGVELAQTQRPNFVNALAGRVAGVEVTSSSGVPGASSQITIRGVSSLSGNNQPLIVVDGLPIDNKTMGASGATGAFVSDFANRGVDFSNRASDINPEDIESIVVLKGAEAAALYGIDAGNGAIVITTKRGKPGQGGFEYSGSTRFDALRNRPELQRRYGQSTVGSSTLLYWGAPYADSVRFYDNVGGFFDNAVSQRHQLAFNGATQDGRMNYRLSTSAQRSQGVVPNSRDSRLNLMGSSGMMVKRWLKVDLSSTYAYQNNDQPFKGDGGPLIGLLVWPQNDNAADYTTADGARRRISNLTNVQEVDNPYFNVNRNGINSRTNRFISNLQLTLTPISWGSLRTNVGVDQYTTQARVLRDPESRYAGSTGGLLDLSNDVTRNINLQTILTVDRQTPFSQDVGLTASIGNQVRDDRSEISAEQGSGFLDPTFISINNTNLRTARSWLSRRRVVGLFGSATADYRRYLFVNVTGRNDWTSTIPQERNSFFYPSINTSFIVTDAFPSLQRFMTLKLRAAYAAVGSDARPYAYASALEYSTASYGGFRYGFSGPNPNLKPEFRKSVEGGFESSFLDDRIGLDLTAYRSTRSDQIVNDVRASYGSGFVLINLNGATTRNTGLEATLRLNPIRSAAGLNWDVVANFDKSKGVVVKLPQDVPEYYNSDTWLYGNVRNGVAAGRSTRSLTGTFYLRNNAGELLISPTTGMPIRSTDFIDNGYDRTPDFLLGVTNNFRRGPLRLSMLVDFRKGGDILNGTEHFLTVRGLSKRTLDRETPVVVNGVLRDGRENTANPTRNSIVLTPALAGEYYLSLSEELFIEKDINWIRLRDVTLSYDLPTRIMPSANVFITGTDLWLTTNYSGLDPIVNGNTAAVGGSGGSGIDYGNFPIPRGFNVGVTMRF